MYEEKILDARRQRNALCLSEDHLMRKTVLSFTKKYNTNTIHFDVHSEDSLPTCRFSCNNGDNTDAFITRAEFDMDGGIVSMDVQLMTTNEPVYGVRLGCEVFGIDKIDFAMFVDFQIEDGQFIPTNN